MKTSRFSDAQIIAILKQAESGSPIHEFCREHGISSATFYSRYAKFGGMDASLMARLKEAVKQGVQIRGGVAGSVVADSLDEERGIYPLADQLTDKDLCEALSDIFVDNEVDYGYIASVARHFPLKHVESVLFEWVAPVCYTNLLSPVPPIWSGFESEALWHDIQALLAREKSAGLVKKGMAYIRQRYLRKEYADEWRKLSALLTESRHLHRNQHD